ncbi:MarR family transcriptional regulator [Pleomorphomonas sp. PLEO]|uniref:MarR family transcriptional regulator n=1 Tax=Pleomorphomonas sp. PLEO TaxID=3239306 RepID=UPI00351E2AC2
MTTRLRRTPSSPKDGPGINHGDIADHNSRIVLELLRVFGALTRRDLSQRLGLTEPAITGILRRLEGRGLVTSRRQAGASRYPVTEFMIRPQGGMALGLRLARRAAAAVLIDVAGNVIAERRDVLPDELIAVGKALLDLKPTEAEVLGVGVALSPDDGVSVEAVREAFAPLTVLANADNATAATAERLIGAGDRDGGFVSILVTRSGVRAGLSIGGRPFHGMHGFAGGIGAMRTGQDRAPLAEGLSPDRLDAAIAASANHEAAIVEWAREAADHLLDAVVAISGVVVPGLIVIGGDLPDVAIDAVVAEILAAPVAIGGRPTTTSWMPPLCRSQLPAGGVALGAALLPIVEFLLPDPRPLRETPVQTEGAAARV